VASFATLRAGSIRLFSFKRKPITLDAFQAVPASRLEADQLSTGPVTHLLPTQEILRDCIPWVH